MPESQGALDSEAGRAWIALGANLGDPRATLLRAMDLISEWSVGPVLRSSLWSSSPVDCPPESPRFLNAVMSIVPPHEWSAQRLLARLQDLEKQFGRKQKTVMNESRPLDLDLLGFRDLMIATPALTVPHPRAKSRRFVLAPLTEIHPDLRLPGWTLSVAEQLRELPCEADSECIKIS